MEIMGDGGVDLLFPRGRDDGPFGAAASGAGEMKSRGFGSAAGQDEVLECRQLRLVDIDEILERSHFRRRDWSAASGQHLSELSGIGRGQFGANGEEVALNRL